MRSLIRPTLFIIARLGLFLVVVAWIVGQWSIVQTSVVMMGRTALGIVAQDGVVVLLVSGNAGWGYEMALHDAAAEHPGIFSQDFFAAEFVTAMRKEPGSFIQTNVPGIVLASKPFRPATAVTVRHWLIVTIFTTFNIALHFIYRKRPEVQPCEV